MKKIAYWMSVVIVGVILGVSMQFARAWIEPTATAPGGNLGAPINTSTNPQTKYGSFIADSLGALYITASNGFIADTVSSSPSVPLIINKNSVEVLSIDQTGNIRSSKTIQKDANGNVIIQLGN